MKFKGHNIKELQLLAQKVINGQASDAEIRFLEEYYQFFENHHAADLDDVEAAMVYSDLKAKLLISTGQQIPKPIKVITMYRLAAVLGLLIVAGVCVYKVYMDQIAKPQAVLVKPHNKSRPIIHGGNKAILTLANGAQISLDDQSSGTLAKQADVNIAKTADGQLTYTDSKNRTAEVVAMFNTMQTPRGGIYKIQLPDGTNVWLNSSTTLTYPVAFNGEDRKVTLNGEAYFEVAHDADHPFMVSTQNQTVTVLGTHFNVNSYPDESISKTTLLQGSVRITAVNANKSTMLSPGEQAVISSQKIKVKNVDTDNAVAWKNGVFEFDNEDIHTIMRKISRWYDVDVAYASDLSDTRFGGAVSRFADIQQVLRKLELTNTIHFKIYGRRIMVMK